MIINGNIFTLYQLLNKQTSYQQILWVYQQTQLYHQDQAVDGALDIVKIKTAGSSYTVSGGGTSGTITVHI